MAERSATAFRSGDALFAFEPDLTVVAWNRAAEELTGVPADEAIGRPCWELLGGHDERGALVCHPGCSSARLAREGWPVPCRDLVIKSVEGGRRAHIATVAIDDDDRRLFLHLVFPGIAPSMPAAERLTPRQQEVLELLADGFPAKVVAARLGVAEATVRNHIRAILVALGAHSQLEAIAKARRLRLVA
jgi:DNA-binding CsgD family transcriptional regulator